MSTRAPTHENEAERLGALRHYRILDTAPEQAFDRITQFAARQFNVPIALISLVDENRQWFKSHCGLHADQTSRDVSFCAHAILSDACLVVPDATLDERFQDNPLVIDEPAIRFYAGAPLKTPDGFLIGTLCLMDTTPHEDFPKEDRERLKLLSEMVIDQLEMRVAESACDVATDSRVAAEKHAKLKSAQLEAFIRHTPVAAIMMDRSGKITAESSQWGRDGWENALESYRIARPQLQRVFFRSYAKVLKGATLDGQISELPEIDGKKRFARWSLHPWYEPGGAIGGTIFLVEDISEQINVAEELAEQRAILETVLGNIQDAILACDADAKTTYINPTALSLAVKAITPQTPLGRDSFVFYESDGETEIATSDLPLRRALSGQIVQNLPMVCYSEEHGKRHLEATAQAVRGPDGAITGAVASLHDVTERMAQEKRLRSSEAEARRIAYTDVLTDYPNRASLQRTLQTDISSLCHAGEKLLFMCLDVVRFKAINDMFGTDIGDTLLRDLADRLSDVVGPRAILGRLSGDEFLIIVPVEEALPFEPAQKVAQLINGQHVLGGQRLSLQISIGAALWPDNGTKGTQLARRADMARLQAKKDAHANYVAFDGVMEESVEQHLRIERDFREALRNEGLSLHYQPIVDAQSGEMTGVEALARWIHPELGFIGPDQFIPVAEQNGSIVDMGDWAFRRAMEDLVDYPGLSLSVNVSPVQFRDPFFVQRLKDALVEMAFDPRRLEIEVTESLFLHDADEADRQLNEIRALGVQVALDDFGTGYSSLSYLQGSNFDKLKIDRSFVAKIGKERSALTLVQSIIHMGKTLNMKITAEGIETEGQALLLRHAGCDSFQGYFYSKPLEWGEVVKRFLTRPDDTEADQAASA